MSQDLPATELARLSIERPRHVAIIMDGNGRWAHARGLPRNLGHKAGVESVRCIVESCIDQRIEALTLFAFSSENWRRPKAEVGLLMELFLATLKLEVARLHKNGVRLSIVGARDAFPKRLQEQIRRAEHLTAGNDKLTLCIAANYGGRWDITEAARRLARESAAGRLDPDAINETMLAEGLALAGLPEPDLFIRTGGEQRISNFLLWDLAYTEFYFTPTLWPDFNAQAFAAAIESFTRRQRRFGHTGEQVERLKGA
jgi:undecaprenyl diphosphate synthase